MFKSVDLHYDSKELLSLYESNFSRMNQVHVSSPDGTLYEMPSGDLRTSDYKQTDFTVINSYFKDSYVEEVYKDLDSRYNICRGRFMKLDSVIRAYSYHQDRTPRIHIPLKTNSDCFFYINGQVVKMPTLGQTYLLNTTCKHSAINLSWEDRIHFVVCFKEPDLSLFNEE